MEYMAKVLFEHWKTSDRELQMVWEELPEGNQIREVFLKQARALDEAGCALAAREA